MPGRTERELFIGLMSGTSLDGIDAVVADFSAPHPLILACHTTPFPRQIERDVRSLCQPGDDRLDKLGATDQRLGELFAEAALAVLAQTNLNPDDVAAIGCHGQTVRHRPTPNATGTPFTLQIGDPNLVAARTGITTVADFRRRDMAFGGQGAPLVPAFHQAVFAHSTLCRAVVNIGGMANITFLPTGSLPIQGFDTGPGNVLLDAWSQRHLGTGFDAGGRWAAGAQADNALLTQLRSHPFFALIPPKSTGREEFNAAWLDEQLAMHGTRLAPQQVQATLLALTAQSITDGIAQLPVVPDEVFVCGGGALNDALMAALQYLLNPMPVTSTTLIGLDPQWVEALAFAWLARQTLRGLPGNVPSVTGARTATVLGAIFPV